MRILLWTFVCARVFTENSVFATGVGRPPGSPRVTWFHTIEQDMKSKNLSLNKEIDVAQNRPLCIEIVVYVWRYALLLVHTRKEEEKGTGQLWALAWKMAHFGLE